MVVISSYFTCSLIKTVLAVKTLTKRVGAENAISTNLKVDDCCKTNEKLIDFPTKSFKLQKESEKIKNTATEI